MAFANDNNDGAHPWPSPPCVTGWYDVKVQYTPDHAVRDTACFYVEGEEGSEHFIEITVPDENTVYVPCAPGEIRWESDIDPGEGEVIDVSWGWYGMCPNIWHSLGLSSNDGVQPWSDPPCDDPDYPYFCGVRVRVEYTSNPSVFDTVNVELGPWFVAGPAIFVDFSGTANSYADVQSRVDPPQYTSVPAYVALVNVPGGFTSVSFAMEVGPPGVFATAAFVNLLPGDLAIGSWDSGITLASTECMGASGSLVYLGHLDLFYLGGEGDVVIVDHPDYPRWIVNCADPGEVLEYTVLNHGGISKEPVSTPVKHTTWGSIKAMFRQ